MLEYKNSIAIPKIESLLLKLRNGSELFSLQKDTTVSPNTAKNIVDGEQLKLMKQAND